MHSRRTARDFCDRAAGIFSRHKTILQEWPNALACYKRWVAEYTNYLATFTQPDELEKAVDDSGLCQVRDIVSAF